LDLEAALFDEPMELYYKASIPILADESGPATVELELDGAEPSDRAFFAEKSWNGRISIGDCNERKKSGPQKAPQRIQETRGPPLDTPLLPPP
jgi:hypothetical protein